MPRLLEIMRALRDPESGCPWDIEQNFKTIAPYTVEEAYEVADAIERENWDDLKNELGDLLLQTVYHTQMAEEDKLFNFNDVVNQISEKMIQRHPHVFGNENRNKTASQQVNDWESIKAEERAKKNQIGILDDVALNLPALVRSLKLQKRAARVGDGWISAGLSLQETKTLIDQINEYRDEFGTLDHPNYQFQVMGEAAYSPEGIKQLEELGATEVIVAFRNTYEGGPDERTLEGMIAEINWYAAEVINKSK